MIRAVEYQGIPYGRVGPWLRTVTVRLCADRRRQVARDSELAKHAAIASAVSLPVEEVACDRAEARWLAARSAELLPARQAEALRLKSQDLDVARVARNMGLSYQATESLLARGRRALRDVLATTLSLAAAVWLFARRFPRTGFAQAAAVTATAATVAVVGLVPPAGPSPRPDRWQPGDGPGGSIARAVQPPGYPVPSGDPERLAGLLDPPRVDRTGPGTSRVYPGRPLEIREPADVAAATEAIASAASVPELLTPAPPMPSMPRSRTYSVPSLPPDSPGAPVPAPLSAPPATAAAGTRVAEPLTSP